jgi:hypothetical protein
MSTHLLYLSANRTRKERQPLPLTKRLELSDGVTGRIIEVLRRAAFQGDGITFTLLGTYTQADNDSLNAGKPATGSAVRRFRLMTPS